MLKRKISKTEHGALADVLKAEYKAEGDDFVLDAEGVDDVAELRRAKDREVQARTAAEQKAADLKKELDTITNTDARRAGDIKTLEKSWSDKLEAEKTSAAAKLAQKDKFIQASLVDGVANGMAAELAGDNSIVILPHIKQRLVVDLSGETPLTRVLDKDGKPSALSVEDLKKEFSNDARFASVVIASRATGGGAAGGNSRSNGGAGAAKKFSEMGDAERTEFYKRDPAGFKQAVETEQAKLRGI